MIKKLAVLGMALCVSTAAYAQKKDLIKTAAKAVSSKAPAALEAQVERQLAQKAVPYSRTIWHRTGTPSAQYNGLLTRITLTETLPARPRSPEHIVQLPDPKSVYKFDFTYRPHAPELQLLQDHVKHYQRWPVASVDPEPLYAFISLVQQDVRGQLTPTDQKQLYTLFFQSLHDRLYFSQDHKHTSYMGNLKQELLAWRTDWRHNGGTPKLVPKNQLQSHHFFELYADEWDLAARIYLAQRIYGDNLPKILQEANVIPEMTDTSASPSRMLKQRMLSQAQETIRALRDSGEWDRLWMKEVVIDIVYDDADKLAFNVRGFYHFFIDKHLKMFPRAKYIKTSQEGRLYEIPLQKGLLLEGPSGVKPITPEEYVVFKADGEKSILLKRTDVELLTDPSSYGE